MEQLPELSSLSAEELQEEYCILFERYKQLREVSEEDAQRIHELKRNLDTALAAEAFLTQELEQITASCTCSELDDHNRSQSSELDELRRRISSVNEALITLQQEYETLSDENAELKKKLLEATMKKECLLESSNAQSEDLLKTLEKENLELLQKIEEFQESNVRYIQALAEREKNIEILRDQISCLEGNLNSKREALEETSQILESTQEQLAEAKAQISSMTSAPEQSGRKGNSLFAEVDDQRQAMKQLLAAQKKSYMQMKKVFNESEYEIRRLKRENIAMHTELQACSTIFCNADKTYQDKLNDRIRNLSNQNEELEKKLNWTQERLRSVASDKGVLWLDSMLSFCKQETDDLKNQLRSVRMQKASLEEQLRSVQQDMARWRFESLKSRCILIDRENVLTEHKIPFKPVTALDFHITDKEIQNARPRIVTDPANNALAVISDQSMKKQSDKTQWGVKGVKDSDKENCLPQSLNPSSITETDVATFDHEAITSKSPQSSDVDAVVLKTSSPFNQSIGSSDQENIRTNDSSTDLKTLPGRPILCRSRDILGEQKSKNVQFSANDPVVHNVSSANLSIDNGDSPESSEVPPVRQYSKSNVIVRHIIIGSKSKNK